MSLYDLSVRNIKKEKVSLSVYKGKVLLIVNTATGCGFTPQYEGLETLYAKFKDRGFEVLDLDLGNHERASGRTVCGMRGKCDKDFPQRFFGVHTLVCRPILS